MRERPSTRRVKAEPVELGSWLDVEGIRAAVPVAALDRVLAEPQKAFPAIAKDEATCRQIERAITTLKSGHVVHNADSRELDLKPESVDLVVTSPPYWTLKRYNEHDAQLGHVQDYEEFLDELDEVWRRCFDALVPGGRLVIVVGDVNVSRKAFGRHMVYPLHASIQERSRLLRYDNLAPIFWYKIANGQYEMGPVAFTGNLTNRTALSRTTWSTSCSSESQAATASQTWKRGSCRSSRPPFRQSGSSRFGALAALRPGIIRRPSLWHWQAD